MTTRWSAVILAGGAGRRLGGRDKPAIVVGGRTLLDRAVEACAGSAEVVVVGPQRSTARPVRWTREDPPGSGPLAALHTGLTATTTAPDVVVVLAADLPSITAAQVARLIDALESADDADAALAADAGGRVQPLVGAYRAEALRAAVIAISDPRDQAFHRVLPRLTVITVADLPGTSDIDTPDDLARWQTRPGRAETEEIDVEREH
ncbi:NTP transferase domain-containing protein [Haloactinopolyspora sp.]|uniref:molybdenum cofactor guanylyltransferase n=1 Tax=Haloactinopolyspora sp. TaxID=1966353 RepID=UPI002618BB09|nr:NTP transferase domain-containing protein [Haloactinopolyspora sp.]